MQLTIDVKDSVLDKVLYLLENLKSDVKIVKKNPITSLEIETISKTDEDYEDLLQARKNRANNPKDYASIDEVNWG